MGCWVSCVEFDTRVGKVSVHSDEVELWLKVLSHLTSKFQTTKMHINVHDDLGRWFHLFSLILAQEMLISVKSIKRQMREQSEAHILEMRVRP